MANTDTIVSVLLIRASFAISSHACTCACVENLTSTTRVVACSDTPLSSNSSRLVADVSNHRCIMHHFCIPVIVFDKDQ
ncbi:hypothetical protein BDR06DRAFT_949623 [Suillus hirtellus]|nr:hypothetical protein BDR06DRAFT_949623 [Suillus hirtellus]